MRHEIGTHRGGNALHDLDLLGAIGQAHDRIEAEYYVVAYARHYRVPLALARAIVKRESNWQPCVVSPKGAVGLMQLMPATAKRLGVTDRCRSRSTL